MKFLLCLLFLAVRVLADGGYVPRPRTGTLAPVEIPGQTAVLAHSEGVETLTIWNTVKSPSADLAWVLPLPVMPTVFQQSDSRPLRALQLAGAPPVQVADFRQGVVMLLLPALAAAMLQLFKRRSASASDDGCLRLAFYGTLVPMLIFGGYGGYGSDSSDGSIIGVQVLAKQMAGDYSTTIIKGTDAGAVDAWLQKAGFPPLTGDQQEAAREYIGKGWVFLCARLTVAAAGLTDAQPLTVQFPSEHPVYPMRFTRSAGTVPVDVFVFSRKTLGDPSGRLREISTGRFRQSEKIPFQRVAEQARTMSADGIPPGKDALFDALRDIPIAGRFSGTFGPDSDWSDVVFTPGAMAPRALHYTTRGGRFTFWLMLLAIPASLLLVCLVHCERNKTACGVFVPPKSILTILRVLLGTLALAGGLAYAPWDFGDEDVIVDAAALQSDRSPPASATHLMEEWFTTLRPDATEPH